MKKRDIMTTGQFAKETGTPYTTVVGWAQNGLMPGVKREETLRGPVWVIPTLDSFGDWKPKIGRPPKPSTAKASKKGRKKNGQ